MTDDQPTRFLVIGGGPAGNTAATIAAANGAAVTLVESSVIGGAAHLWDCIPSKAMVASSRRMAAVRDSGALGLADIPPIAVDMERLSAHRVAITENLVSGLTDRRVSTSSRATAASPGRTRPPSTRQMARSRSNSMWACCPPDRALVSLLGPTSTASG